jgi:hypothetical protein
MGEMSPEARGLLRCAGFLVWFLAGLPLFLRLTQTPGVAAPSTLLAVVDLSLERR